MSVITEESYNEYHYKSMAFEETSPGHIAGVAALFGLSSAELESARILELGCASGGNLIPLAVANPETSFVGIDLSMSQIEIGQTLVDSLALKNTTLVAMSLENIDETFGKFDFIIAHGLFSWVPESTQKDIFKVIRTCLSDDGLAYVSFNALPGWHLVHYLRDLMLFGSRNEKTLATKVKAARATLAEVVNATKHSNGLHADLIRLEAAILDNKEDYYLVHDHLENENHPVLFENFIALAQEEGLHFVSDADLGTMFPEYMAPATRGIVEAEQDRVSQQQMFDFCVNRRFRKTILANRPILYAVPKTSSLDGLFFYCQLAEHTPFDKSNLFDDSKMRFITTSGTHYADTNKITKQIIYHLSSLHGSRINKNELSIRMRRLSPELDSAGFEETLEAALLALVCRATIKVDTGRDRYNLKTGTNPEASALAREQSKTSDIVTNLRHQNVRLNNREKFFLPLLDGMKTLQQIAIEITIISSKTLPADHPIAIIAKKGEEHLLQELNMMLEGFRKNGLLM